jgi:hypothetical protein
MVFEVPQQQERYKDTGRREIVLLGRTVLASLVKLKEADANALRASHEIFVEKLPGVPNQQLQGQVINFDGRDYRVIKVTDPKISDPVMRGRYLRLISTAVAPD